jgi:serine/threonine protein kinase
MSELKLLQCRVDGRYDIEDCLGRGSYAEIYLARDNAATDERFRNVVIKALNVLLQGYQDTELEQTLIQNFQNEAVALDRVRHPNIISRLGHGTAIDLNGTAFHYLVLEYLGGGDLAKVCRTEPLTLDRALYYLQQVCAGLAHAHECGIIHRDIKPQNLLLTADREIVKIADFGVARIEASEGAITRVGTNVYAAPEHNPLVQTSQLDIAASLRSSVLTPAADIYSLAKTAYTMICGVSPRAFAHQPITELPSPISVRPWASSLLRVLERGTQNRPADRYQTVQDFWDDLNDVGMPVTQPLISAHPQRRISADLNVDEGVTEAAPPRPRFETSREIKQQIAGLAGPHPRIVVPIRGAQGLAQDLTLFEPGRVQVPVPANGSTKPAAAPAGLVKPRGRGRDFMVGLLLVLCFAGLLLATGAYVRSWIRQRVQQTTAATTSNDTGRQAITVTDVNLRAGPNRQTDVIGLAESGSRVQILTMSPNSSWCEVQILQHSRPKDDPSSSDRGWLNRTFLKFD